MAASNTSGKQSGFMMQPQNYSVNDGEGIRTVLFLSGCPLRCKWCANPESFTPHTHFVSEYGIQDVCNIVERESIFYRFSKGGITFSGGEPTLQLPFLETLSKRFYDEGYDLAMETCGYFDFDQVQPILERMNLIFMDIKTMDLKQHLAFTGKSNHLILENIKKIGKHAYPLVIRIPLIEGVNASDENIGETARFVKHYMPHPKIEMLPYHELGAYKYDDLCIDKPSSLFKRPSDERIQVLKEIIESEGVEVVSFS